MNLHLNLKNSFSFLLFFGGGLGLATPALSQNNDKPFLNREHICLIKVTEVGFGVFVPDNEPYKSIPVTVEVLAVLPPRVKIPKIQVITLDVPAVNPAASSPFAFIPTRPTQDWFPALVGNKAVIAINDTSIPSRTQFHTVGSLVFPEKTWRDCQSFAKIIENKKEDQGEAFTKYVRENYRQLTPVFFELIAAYSHKIGENKDFCLAGVQYLQEDTIPLQDRIKIIDYIYSFHNKYAESNKAIAKAIIQLILEGKGSKQVDIGNVLWSLCRLCVSDRTAAELPELEESVRAELLKLSSDKTVFSDQRVITPLHDWLQGKPIRPVPGITEERLKLEMKLPPPQAKEPEKSNPIPKATVTPEKLPREEQIPQLRSEGQRASPLKAWQTTGLATIGGVFLLTLGFLGLILWRRRQASV